MRARLGGSHEFGVPSRTVSSLRNAQEHGHDRGRNRAGKLLERVEQRIAVCFFSSGGSTAIPHVIVLAKHMEKPSIYTKYHKPNMTIDDPAPINAAINTVPSKPTIMAVNIGRTGPNLSSSDPETGALAAPSNAPGSNTTPAASTDAPNPSCEAFGII